MDKDIRKTVSQADTYIEECFENKCYEHKNHEAIINQWRNDKKNFKKYISLTSIDFQHYSMHDESHSVAILQNIEMVLGRKRVEALNASDLWLLLECAYSHDIGMVITYEGLCTIWESKDFKSYVTASLASELSDRKKEAVFYSKLNDLVHNKDDWEKYASDIHMGDADDNISEFDDEFDDMLSKDYWFIMCEKYIMRLYTEYIRKKHPERSEKFLLLYKEGQEQDIPDRMYIVAASVIALHGKNFDDIFKDVHVKERGFFPELMHPQFAAAMLRLGDLLDMDSNRFNLGLINHMGLIPMESNLHLKKHKAMTHLCYSENVIEAEAKSNEIEVCKKINDWFVWLDEEVKNLICHWNQMVPCELYGCLLNQCKLCIYHQDGLFDARQQTEFVADSDRVYKIFIGNNIYKSRLDFIREYIQNALDASKMKLWMKIKGDQKLWNKYTKENITPYDIDDIWFEQYAIAVEAHISWTTQELILSFQDRGIGMEKECIEGLSHIANDNWRKRSIYADEIPHMPLWLKPTGGFGIGIQSAFMITDTIEFITKSDHELYGNRIQLESKSKGGKVSVYEDKKAEEGTKVQIKVRLADFFKEALRDKDFYFETISGNLFDRHDISKIILGILNKYISATAKFSLFPINLKCDKEKECTIGMGWRKALDGSRIVLAKAKDFHYMDGNNTNLWYSVTESQVFLWIPCQGLMVIYTDRTTANIKEKDSCYYKGIWISDEDLTASGNCNVQIVYFQDDVSKNLTINRDRFRQDHEGKFQEDIMFYKYLYAKLLAHNPAELIKCKISSEMALNAYIYYFLGEIQLGENEYNEIKAILPKSITVQEINGTLLDKKNEIFEQEWKKISCMDDEIYEQIIENTLFVLVQKDVNEFISDLEKSSYFIYSAKKQLSMVRISVMDFIQMLLEQMQQPDLERKPQGWENWSEKEICWNIIHGYSYIITEEEICRILDKHAKMNGYIDIKEDNRYIMRIACSGKNNASISLPKSNIKEFGKKELKTAIREKLRQPIVLCTTNISEEDSQNRLWITQIVPDIRPFSLDENRRLNWFEEGKQNMKYLVLPFTEQMRKRICDEIEENGGISKAKYNDITKKEEELKLLIEWVYIYQNNSSKLKPTQIWEQYVKLLDLFYEISFSDMSELE